MYKIKKKFICVMLISLLICHIGCAPQSTDITPTYVSPMHYNHYECDQILAELNRVRRQLSSVCQSQDDSATNDAVAMTVGMVIFWPALFFLIGGDKKEEVARLKGEYEALEQAAIQKKCYEALDIIEADKKAEEEARKKEEESEGNNEPYTH